MDQSESRKFYLHTICIIWALAESSEMVGHPSGNHRNPSGNRRNIFGKSSETPQKSSFFPRKSSATPRKVVGNGREPLGKLPGTHPDMSRKPLGPLSSKRNRGHLSCYYILVRVDLMSERNSNLNLVGLNFCPPHYACRPTRCLRSSQRESCRLRPPLESILSTAKRVVREFVPCSPLKTSLSLL